jgi:transcriptional regulator with XRE-family HTH domain
MEFGRQLDSRPEARLVEQLQDPEYRRAFVEGHATDSIAFQLRAMRKAEGLEQKDVAEKLGNRKLQPMISRYENPDYGKYSVSTLLELAAVFDVALAVRFVPFSELVEWDLSSNPAKECPAPFQKDTKLEEIAKGIKDPEARASGSAKPSPKESSVCDEQSLNRPHQERSELGSINAANESKRPELERIA